MTTTHHHLPVPGAWLGLVALVVSLPGTGWAALEVGRWSVDGGGTGLVQAGPFTLGATIGQHDAGRLAAGTFVLTGGFWAPGSGVVTGVDDGDDGSDSPPPPAPTVLRIYPAAPNPLREATRIAFDLPEPCEVEMRIFDVTGAQVRVLGTGTLPAGQHSIQWNASDAYGRSVNTGLYFVRMRIGQLTRSQKLIVVR